MKRKTVSTFPARLKELREKAGLSRDQLAVAADSSSHSIAKLEQGIRAPSFQLACRLASALGCSLDALAQPPESEQERPGRGRPRKE